MVLHARSRGNGFGPDQALLAAELVFESWGSSNSECSSSHAFVFRSIPLPARRERNVGKRAQRDSRRTASGGIRFPVECRSREPAHVRRIGSLRILRPVAAKMALQTAGANGPADLFNSSAFRGRGEGTCPRAFTVRVSDGVIESIEVVACSQPRRGDISVAHCGQRWERGGSSLSV